MLVMHIAYVALQISLKVAAVATVTALEVLHLQQGKVHLKGILAKSESLPCAYYILYLMLKTYYLGAMWNVVLLE